MKHKGSLIFAIIGILLFATSICTVKYLESKKNEEHVQASNEKLEENVSEESVSEESSVEIVDSSADEMESSMIEDESVSEESVIEESSDVMESEVIEESSEVIEDSSLIDIDLSAPVEFDIEDNIYLDALTYTGYNMEKHREDGLMWTYVLSAEKAGKGWLSDITYGSGSTGLETTEEGLPDIEDFEMGGLVCASFASYVYFNYLPNVAGVDTSCLTLPDHTPSANSFYEAAKQWLADGYTRNIGFDVSETGEGIVFEPYEEIPIGSILVFHDYYQPGKTTADHITVYVGEKNGYHWVIQTGNKNGPEFCAVERFKFGPDPMWPMAIFTTPTCVYESINAQNAGIDLNQ